jgi:hypothetical protein
MSGTSRLKISGYSTFTDGMPGSRIADYTLQINPESFDISYKTSQKGADSQEASTAAGVPTIDKKLAYPVKTANFSFYIDNSGAVPRIPQGVSQPTTYFATQERASILTSVQALGKVCLEPQDETHQSPYVELQWGTYSLVGKVNKFEVAYLKFNSSGDPIRARITMSVEEEVDDKVVSRGFKSPDITRIPTIKEDDNLLRLCHSFYDDSQYFIKVAQFNKLPTFRKLKTGSQIEFPPLEK